MTVYVDDMRAKFGRMVMCHMLADTDAELLAMADRIGVQRKWHQYPGTFRSHFDIALSKRAEAVTAGAVEITWRQAGMVQLHRRMVALGKAFASPIALILSAATAGEVERRPFVLDPPPVYDEHYAATQEIPSPSPSSPRPE